MDENSRKNGTFWVPMLVLTVGFTVGLLVAVLL